MWEFNWGMFWSVLAALAVRGIYRGIGGLINASTNS
jgi:hypothetical protein